MPDQRYRAFNWYFWCSNQYVRPYDKDDDDDDEWLIIFKNSNLLYNTVNYGDLTNKNIGRKQGFRLKESGQGNDIRP